MFFSKFLSTIGIRDIHEIRGIYYYWITAHFHFLNQRCNAHVAVKYIKSM